MTDNIELCSQCEVQYEGAELMEVDDELWCDSCYRQAVEFWESSQ